jgi:hypothetical protein
VSSARKLKPRPKRIRPLGSAQAYSPGSNWGRAPGAEPETREKNGRGAGPGKILDVDIGKAHGLGLSVFKRCEAAALDAAFLTLPPAIVRLSAKGALPCEGSSTSKF